MPRGRKKSPAKEPKDDKNNVDQSGAERIEDIGISEEMRSSYISYAMSVIVARALPDVRDGLKPVHRRILYAMHKMGLSPSAKFRKSAQVVGHVLGHYHPHGDSAVYDAMVNMAQDFGMRYPLVAGQGNFGSIDGDGAAAARYTEAKMAKLSEELLRDIEKDTVDFVPNYDATTKEPLVLPTRVPALLLNGTLGIAVGMATKIPPHNLTELMEALVFLADNPKATTDDLLQYIKGPDFPTGGLAFNKKDIAHAYSSGRGGVVVRGEAEIVESKASHFQIEVTSIPYKVNKSELIIKIADLVQSKKIEGVKDIRDESTTLDDTKIVIELKGGGHPQKVLNALYKHTDLESTFHYNMLALVDGVPQTLSLKSILEEFLGHRKDVVRRRTEFELKKAKDRAHILEGLKKALDHIDAIIKTIKKSKDVNDARAALMKQFKFTEMQASAILEMKLQKLAGLERKKIEDELKEKKALIKELESILKNAKKLLGLVKDEFQEIIEKFGDERRTKIIKGGVKEINVEDLIPEEESVLVLTRGGYVKRTRPDEYKKQRRGGVGVVDLNTKEEDFITIFQTANTHATLLFFTDRGKVYSMKMYDMPEGKRATRGKSIMNFLSLADGERVTSVLPLPKEARDQEGLAVLMVTRDGVAKKVTAESFHDVRRSGIIAINLTKGDELLSVNFVRKDDTAIVATRKGQSIRFKESDVRAMGRAAGGVRAIKLAKGDELIGADVIVGEKAKEATFLVMSENGYGKRTDVKEYKIQNRGGSGIKTAKVTGKNGEIMVGKVIYDDETEVVAISKNGQVIRVSSGEIPTLGRQTQGVKIMKMRSGDNIASLTCL